MVHGKETGAENEEEEEKAHGTLKSCLSFWFPVLALHQHLKNMFRIHIINTSIMPCFRFDGHLNQRELVVSIRKTSYGHRAYILLLVKWHLQMTCEESPIGGWLSALRKLTKVIISYTCNLGWALLLFRIFSASLYAIELGCILQLTGALHLTGIF